MDLFAEFLDVGTRAILAGVCGNEEEYRRLIKRGRELKAQMDRQQLANLIEESDRGFDRKRKKEKPRKPPALTSNLGDALRAAGVVVKDGGSDE